MLASPRRLAGLALLALAGLVLAAARPAPLIAPAEAARWEGQRVRVSGSVQGLEVDDARLRFDLVDEGHRVSVVSPVAAVTEGQHLVAEGRLLRSQGTLRLVVDASRDLDL